MDELFKKYKVLVCAGSGGVGKTTLAASLGVRAAQSGLNVLVLTIDPSLRLANSLGLSRDSDEDTFVPGQNYSGKLYGALLNSKKTFDEFVKESATKPGVYERVMKNRLYIQLSTKLSGSQEFTALQRLYKSVESGKYDLVILDTPPTKHAVDFLRAPQKLYSLFQDSIIRWFINANEQSKSVFSIFAAKVQTFNILKKVTGSDFIIHLVDFFEAVQGWQEKVRDRTIEVQRLLAGPDTSFVLISSFDVNKIDEADYFYRELKKGGYRLSAIILNRALPMWLTDGGVKGNKLVNQELQENYDKLVSYYEVICEFYERRKLAFNDFKKTIDEEIVVLQVPDFNQDICGLPDLENLSDVAMGRAGDK